MKPDRLQPLTTRRALWMRRVLLIGLLLTAFYIATYAINSRAGGYWSAIVYEFSDGNTVSTPAIHWQPRFGYWEGYSDEWLGRFYSPLIRLDRHFFHPTHYVQDPNFFPWAQALKYSDWHPGSRDAFFALTENQIEKGVAKSDLIVIARPWDGGVSGRSGTLLAQVISVLTGNLPKGDTRGVQVFYSSEKTWPHVKEAAPAFILFLTPAQDSNHPDCYFDVTAKDQPFTVAALGNINSLRAELDLMKSTSFSWKTKPATPRNIPEPP
ncbi:MAG: hypothetical protein ABJF10_21910 [Chthoniobacter sp.]|uniref:hypothetical protein n=1 Tax=Chthoniobacter sp. TaxID=2510640 RepID=UPI0032A231BF